MSAVLLAALGTGCLIPQSVDPIQTRPHTVPRVDPTTLPPYLLQPFLTLDPQQLADASPCHCQLEVDVGNIIADDPTVDIEIRVFLDYDLNVPSTQPPIDRITLPGSFNNPSTTRSLTSPLIFDLAKLRAPGMHVIELVFGEREGFASTDVSPPQRAMLPGFESSTFKFVVQALFPNTRQGSCADMQVPPQTKATCP